MPANIRTLSLTDARRLVIERQHLSDEPAAAILDVVRDIGCLQLDPTSAVQRNHLLVLWSRIGNYDIDEVERLMYQDRALFEYWAHVASIVMTEDYPIFQHWMKRYPDPISWGISITGWLKEDAAQPYPLRQQILDRIRAEGPLTMRDFEGEHDSRLQSSGWTSSNTISRMFDFLWQHGDILVSHRKGTTRYWDVAERVLPDWTPREELTQTETVRRAAQRAIRCLGVATSNQIKVHFTRHRYFELADILKSLVKDGLIMPVKVEDNGAALPGDWYMNTDDLPRLERIQSGAWQPKTTLLSPFDNLICDRDRLKLMWDYDFRLEIYVPVAKRQYGYFVLSILHGDKIIGRIDPLMDRKTKRLAIKAVHVEDHAPDDIETIGAVRGSIERLAAFLGATDIDYGNIAPRWKHITA